MNKVCSKCKEVKSLDAFGKRSASKDWLRSHCNACRGKLWKVYYQNNQDKTLERAKVYHHTNRKKILEKQKVYRQINREKVLKMYKAYRQKSREIILSKQKIKHQVMSETYVIQTLKQTTSLTTQQIQLHPELIEFKRAQILLNRAIKEKSS